MSVVEPGPAILELAQSSNVRFVVVAPYIKAHALRKLIAAIPPNVSEFVCITRWLPEDIASGVCDIEIFDDIIRRDGELRVHPSLHAKFYSNTEQCLIGSANLTGRGLGWHSPSNVELLVALPRSLPGLLEWETALLNSSVKVTRELRDRLHSEALAMRESMPAARPPEVEATDDEQSAPWVPTCTVPDQLWSVYQGQGSDSIVTSAYDAAQRDLAILSPPKGLDRDVFKAYVAGILRQMPLFLEIDRLASTGVTDSQAHQCLSERLGVDKEAVEPTWRVLKLWLVHFFPDSYRLETGQDVLVKGKTLRHR